VSTHRRTDQRVVVAHPVELSFQGRRIHGMSQDLSRGGVFVRSNQLLPVGASVELALDAGSGPVRIAARVAHVLPGEAARSLGRFPGMGLSFGGAAEVAADAFSAHLADFIDPSRRPLVPAVNHARAVVADPSTRLLERVTTALGNAGFEVVTATNGAEAYAACLLRPPDVLLAALHMPVMSGLSLLRTLGASAELAAVPFALMSHDSSDLARLRAYQAGVADFIPKPFTVAELAIRVRRLVRATGQSRVVLRGALQELSLPTLLAMFELEQKTGILTIAQDDHVVWLTLARGRVVRARTIDEEDARTVLRRVLAWREGHFELTACEVLDGDRDDVGMSTTHLLLEHARVEDELRRQRS
jgi:DNA-binding response OmpR family regulator/Tfp pilus assembly protein PilZ